MIRILILIHAIFLLSANILFPQVTQEWAKTYFNETKNVYARVIAVDTLGNVYSAGAGGNLSWVVVKYNSNGVEQWVNRYYLNSGIPEYIEIDKNNDIYLVGLKNNSNYLLVKISASGSLLWQRTYSGTSSGNPGIAGLIITKSNCPIVSGTLPFSGTKEDLFTIKYNTNGDTIWTARYNSLNNNADVANSLAISKDGNILVTGHRVNYAQGIAPSFLTVKYDSNGVFKWARIYGNPDSTNALVDGTFDNNGNVYVLGYLNLYAYCTIKYNSNGDLIWSKVFSSINISQPRSVSVDNSNNIIVTGNDYSSTQRFLSTIKYDSLGNQLWINNLSQISPNFTDLNNRKSMKIDNSNNIYLTGSYYIISSGSQKGIFTAKINSNGILDWYKTYFGNVKLDYGGYAIFVDKYKNVYSVGTTQDSLNGFGIVTIKYSQLISISQISNEVPDKYKLYQNYPNPFNPFTKIKYEIQKNSMVQLKVFDMLGREVQALVSEVQNAGTYETSFNGQNLASGIYIYELKVVNQNGYSTNFKEVKRMVLIK